MWYDMIWYYMYDMIGNVWYDFDMIYDIMRYDAIHDMTSQSVITTLLEDNIAIFEFPIAVQMVRLHHKGTLGYAEIVYTIFVG